MIREEIQERAPGDFDQSEVKIIRLLQRNGRMSTAELARETGTSEPTVRRKLARLIDDGVITIRAVSDPVALGYAAPAYIGLDVERHRIEEVAQALSSYPMIETVAVITGPFDILVKAAFHSTAELYDFVLKELAKVKGIKDSHSFLVLRNFKHEGLTTVAERVPKKLERPAIGP